VQALAAVAAIMAKKARRPMPSLSPICAHAVGRSTLDATLRVLSSRSLAFGSLARDEAVSHEQTQPILTGLTAPDRSTVRTEAVVPEKGRPRCSGRSCTGEHRPMCIEAP
jgi:hypothetical protein